PFLARREACELARKTFRIRPVRRSNNERREPPERRIGRTLPRFDLAVVERLAVGGDQRLHYRMLGLMCLQIANAPPLLAARTPDHLIEQLKSTLSRARIAVAKAEIGIDHADEVEAREVVALRHELR